MARPDKRRERWMTNFENLVIEQMPEASGKIEWESAVYFFNTNLTSDEAAAKYIATRKKA
jgi:hypothetical protein